MSKRNKPVPKMRDLASGKRLGYKAQIRALKEDLQGMGEALNLAATEAVAAKQAGRQMRDIIQLIVEMADDHHGYRLKCGCDDCKAITGTLQELAKHEIIELPELDESLIVTV